MNDENNIFDSFDNFGAAEETPDENSCVIEFGTESLKIDLSDEQGPKTLEDAFRQYARRIGTTPDANVTFRTTEAVPGTTRLEANTTYSISVEAAKHG